jgi:group I intron endonuclease
LRDDLMILYEIRNTINDKVYVGITRTSLNMRYRGHKYSSKSEMTPLYCAIRKYGIDKFKMEPIGFYENTKDLEEAEYNKIAEYRLQGIELYNTLDGGASYFPIKDLDEWKTKLSIARQGRTPALGMKHSENNKKLFSICGKARWDKYGRYPNDVINLSFKEATEKYGISRTHYYRLKKLATTNDGS